MYEELSTQAAQTLLHIFWLTLTLITILLITTKNKTKN